MVFMSQRCVIFLLNIGVVVVLVLVWNVLGQSGSVWLWSAEPVDSSALRERSVADIAPGLAVGLQVAVLDTERHRGIKPDILVLVVRIATERSISAVFVLMLEWWVDEHLLLLNLGHHLALLERVKQGLRSTRVPFSCLRRLVHSSYELAISRSESHEVQHLLDVVVVAGEADLVHILFFAVKLVRLLAAREAVVWLLVEIVVLEQVLLGTEEPSSMVLV